MPLPHHSVFTGQMPFLPPNQQRLSTDGIKLIITNADVVFAGLLVVDLFSVQVEVKKATTKTDLKELNPKSTTNQLACVGRPDYAPLYQQGA